MAVEVFARAKVNLALHITGLRDDGYHLLDSLVGFPDIGDRLSFEKSDTTELSVTGPFASSVPTDRSNLIIRAADLMDVTAHISLEKNLPVESGIGGGSADAAAALQGLSALYGLPLPPVAEALKLGADVPACLAGGLLRMRGIGEEIDILDTRRFDWPLLLVNPGIAVSTPSVFRALAVKHNPPMRDLPSAFSGRAFVDWLSRQRNDLEEPAIRICPPIATVLDAIRKSPGCVLERMSGSGATCFGLFESTGAVRAAAAALKAEHPDWWVAESGEI